MAEVNYYTKSKSEGHFGKVEDVNTASTIYPLNDIHKIVNLIIDNNHNWRQNDQNSIRNINMQIKRLSQEMSKKGVISKTIRKTYKPGMSHVFPYLQKMDSWDTFIPITDSQTTLQGLINIDINRCDSIDMRELLKLVLSLAYDFKVKTNVDEGLILSVEMIKLSSERRGNPKTLFTLLDVFHSLGTSHMDIKKENIMSFNGELYFVDLDNVISYLFGKYYMCDSRYYHLEKNATLGDIKKYDLYLLEKIIPGL